jgi:hypothetical protein
MRTNDVKASIDRWEICLRPIKKFETPFGGWTFKFLC